MVDGTINWSVSAQQRSGPVRFGAGIGGDSGPLQVKQPILATRWWKCSSCFIEWRLLGCFDAAEDTLPVFTVYDVIYQPRLGV